MAALKSDNFSAQVLVCYPADRSKLREIARRTNQRSFVPSVEHTLMQCDSCGCDVWVGPQQRVRVNSPLISITKMCPDCTARMRSTLGLRPVPFQLDPDEDQIPRRVG